MTKTDDIVDPTSVFDPLVDEDEDLDEEDAPTVKKVPSGEMEDEDSVEKDDDVDELGGNRYGPTEELDVTKIPVRTPSDPPEKEPEI